jgi:hypothetical protein
MKSKWLLAVAAGAVTLLSGIVLAATAAAQTETTYYCVNGQTVPPPAQITASSETAGDLTASVDEAWAADILAASPSGVFYVGYVTGDNWYWMDDSGDPSAVFEPGYSTNYAGYGACNALQKPYVPEPARVAVCKMVARGDGTMGAFQEITVAQWNDEESQYFDAPAANWVEGLGLTCDNPLELGYKAAGYNVAWGGLPDAASDPNGVRGSGMNNIYPYFTK